MSRLVITATLAAVLLIPGLVFAQANFDLRYDPQTLTTVSGTVLTTINYNPGNPAAGPRALVISSNNQIYTVFLGPGWYVNQIGFAPSPGTRITVTGSLRNISGQAYIVARGIRTPAGTFGFRNTAGVPLWSGSGVIVPPSGSGTMVVPPPPPIGAGPTIVPIPTARVPFDANNIVEVSGKIRETYTIQTAEDNLPSVVAVIEDERILRGDRTFHVLLAPMSFLTQNGISLQRGNTLFVQGSRVNITGQNVIVATNVEEGENFISLRTESGISLFSPLTPPVGAGPGRQVPLVPFDTNRMVEVSGKIRETTLIQTAEDNVPSVVALIEDERTARDDDFYRVLLGPQSYLAQNGISMQRGNTLFVQGSRVNIGGMEYIVATNVEEGENIISLRTNTGVALFPAFTAPRINVPSPPRL